jgi:hypothetical protein
MNARGAGSCGPSRARAPSAASKTNSTRSTRDLLPAWYAFRHARAARRAVRWLAENSLIDAAAGRFVAGHPDPGLP